MTLSSEFIFDVFLPMNIIYSSFDIFFKSFEKHVPMIFSDILYAPEYMYSLCLLLKVIHH